MSTVRRDFRSVPKRDTIETWRAIVDLITASSQNTTARRELMSVAGIVANAIADQTPRSSPIVFTCDGPRTRVYCVYDDDAIDGSSFNEQTLGFDATKGNWQVSVPVGKEDLSWTQAALKRYSSRVVARDTDRGIEVESGRLSSSVAAVALDLKAFLQS